jgi:hypothetical protein
VLSRVFLWRPDRENELAEWLRGALADDLKLLALTLDERSLILASLEDPPEGLGELRGVLVKEHQSRQREGLY